MSLYTIVADYRGGTYLTQVIAENEKHAAASWSDTEAIREIAMPLDLPLDALREELKSPDGFPVGDLQNCWCVTAVDDGGLLLLHIIETVEQE